MRYPPRRLAPPALLALGILLAGSPASLAQVAPPPAQPAPAPEREPSLAEVVGEAGSAETQLRQIEAGLAPSAALEEVAAKLPEHLEQLGKRAELAFERLEQATQMRQLSDTEKRWLTELATLERWRSDATGRALAAQEGLKEIDQLIAKWEKTLGEARELGVPIAVTERIGRTLDVANTVREKVSESSAEMLGLQAAIAGGLATVAEVLERTRRGQQAIRGGLLGTDSLPVWTALQERGEIGERLEAAGKSIEHDFEVTRDFAALQGLRLAVHAVFYLLMLVVMLALRPRAVRWALEDESAAASAGIFGRPYAAATVIAAIASPLLYPQAPTYFQAAFALLALGATLRLIPPLLERGARAAFYALAGFFVLDTTRDILAGVPLLARLLFEIELSLAIAVVVGLLNPKRLSEFPRAGQLLSVFVLVRRLTIALLGIALLGSALGYVSLSRLLGDGVLDSAYLGVVLYAGQKVVCGMISIALRSEALQELNLIRDHRPLITRRLLTWTRLGAFAVWVLMALESFQLRSTLGEGIAAVLSASLTVGELEVSLGDFVAFALAITITIYVARFLRYLLDEDVLPRLSLARGVDDAISTSVYYAALMFGLFASVAAAGFDLSRFTLLAGALGVGIGFGLQNVVNNFVSGFILLFEPHLKTGDTIEIGELIGEVRRIGIRSSTVRTWSGAEVIVPNASLISNQVVNWTLSDRQRRIDIDVGVRYGTDPERVLELLLGVAKADERVLDHPEPSALFMAHGESSLDFRLRAWTAYFDLWMLIKSDLTVATNRALAEAGIEIPFPQRDLHVRSVP